MRSIPQGASDHAAVAQVVERQQNEARLRACAGPHRFVREVARTEQAVADEPRIVDHRTPPGGPRPRTTPTGMMRCQLCHGRVTAEQAEWYATGVMHGMAVELARRSRPAPLTFDDGLDGKKGVV